jgi:hypothetical protein
MERNILVSPRVYLFLYSFLLRKRRAANWTILSDISLDTHGVDVMVMPRIAVVLEVLIMAMMLSLSLMDITRHAYRRAASKATVACTI